ncbi:hypothetical protein H5410_036165, partial [Solanum commersonii]
CVVEDCSTRLVEIADELGDIPFGQLIALRVLERRAVHVISVTRQVKLGNQQDSISCSFQPYLLRFAPKINCVLKDSNCETPSPKILMLAKLATCASSSSTKISKCPRTKNDSIFTPIYKLI